MTVTLRPATRADGVWIGGWLPAVARVAGYDPESNGAAVKRLIIERVSRNARGTAAPGCESVGIVICRQNTPKRGEVIIDLVATTAEHAGRGAGMTAATLLETELRARGVRRIFAPASASHGIAMYFWIRLGYRPLLRGEWPCVREGVAWLARDL